MPRLTKAEREIGDLLQEFDKAKQHKRDAEKEYARLQALVEKIQVGSYAGWEKSYGEPREIMDQPAVRNLFAELQLEIPMAQTKAPLIVREIR